MNNDWFPDDKTLTKEMEEVAKDMDAEDREFYRLFRDFTSTPQWKKLEELGSRYIRKEEIDIVYGDDPHHIRNIKRGICKGIVLMLEMPDLLFEQGARTMEKLEDTNNED